MLRAAKCALPLFIVDPAAWSRPDKGRFQDLNGAYCYIAEHYDDLFPPPLVKFFELFAGGENPVVKAVGAVEGENSISKALGAAEGENSIGTARAVRAYDGEAKREAAEDKAGSPAALADALEAKLFRTPPASGRKTRVPREFFRFFFLALRKGGAAAQAVVKPCLLRNILDFAGGGEEAEERGAALEKRERKAVFRKLVGWEQFYKEGLSFLAEEELPLKALCAWIAEYKAWKAAREVQHTHFALYRRNFIPLFYRVSGIFLPPFKIRLWNFFCKAVLRLFWTS
jgi:hypothetical protein